MPNPKLDKSYRLKNVPSLVLPELLFALAKAGAGESFLIAASAFPSETVVKREKIVRLAGVDALTALTEVLKLIKLDGRAKGAAVVPKPDRGQEEEEGAPEALWAAYETVLRAAEGRRVDLTKVDKDVFLEQAKKVRQSLKSDAILHLMEVAIPQTKNSFHNKS